MFRLGVRLTLRGGREALVRLALIAAAVAIGVTVLLAVLAEFHGFQTANGRQCWECTTGSAPAAAASSGATVSGAQLWSYRQDYYEGRTIERLDVAVLGPGAPVVSGTSRMPGSGEYFASPAMARLLRSVPADELADRFPGRLAGTIGDRALSGPDELVIIVGNRARQLARVRTPVGRRDCAGGAGRLRHGRVDRQDAGAQRRLGRRPRARLLPDARRRPAGLAGGDLHRAAASAADHGSRQRTVRVADSGDRNTDQQR